ncbi:DUF3833 domain-containing protein [Marinobacteraceae bacterium S3BR75-40.1]
MVRVRVWLLGGAFVAVALAACSSIDVEQYATRKPSLDPKSFFYGKICADGIVKDWSGEQIRQFNARILASWDEAGVGTLDEVFQFDDGRETRTWTLTPTGDGTYRASAGDLVEPTTMRFAGNSIHMQYTLRYGEPDDTIDLAMNDWMYQVADGVVINQTQMSKWGLAVGEILLVMRRVDADVACLPGENAATQDVPQRPSPASGGLFAVR